MLRRCALACLAALCGSAAAQAAQAPVAHPGQPSAAQPAAHAAAAPASAQSPAAHPTSTTSAGRALYQRTCASCHDHSEQTRAPPLATLRSMRYETLDFALTEGKMRAQGAGLSAGQRAQLIDFIVARRQVSDAWIARMMCPPANRTVDLNIPATVSGFGFDLRNHRRLTRAQSGLATRDLAHLELAWALAFPGVTTLRAQPAVVGSTIFLPVWELGKLFAIDVSGPPCFKWVYSSEVPLRTSAAYGSLPGSGRKVLAFSDAAAQVHLIDAHTGQLLWRRAVRLTAMSNATGTPVIHGDRVYVPLSASEVNAGADPNYECCKTHGAVFALDVRTGRKVWVYETMPDAKPIGDRGDGHPLWGPSGAPIWSSPAIDDRRGLLYVGTGEATSEPAAETTDSILAIDLATGALRWRFQATNDDVFLTGCWLKPGGLNCPRHGRELDVDFGASAVVARRPDGRDVILAGQKSSTLWALDPEAGGKVLWSRSFGPGSPLGGIHWGIAFDGKRVFAPVSVLAGRDGLGAQRAGLHAVDVMTGAVQWSYFPQPDCSGNRAKRVRGCATSIGLSGAPTLIDGAVVTGSLDGYLRAFDAQTGELLFQFDTARVYRTLNGVPGSGGSIDNASIVAAHGLLFVNSGYGLIGGQTPGNVFLAFRPHRSRRASRVQSL